MGGSRDPRRPMDVEAHVVVPAEDALARVESHSNTDCPDPGGPGFGREGALCGDRRRHCRHGAPEDDEECVSLGRDLDPTGRLDRSAHHGVVAFDERAEGRAQGGHEAGRPLDVREQERQRTDGEGSSARPGQLARHPASIRRGRMIGHHGCPASPWATAAVSTFSWRQGARGWGSVT